MIEVTSKKFDLPRMLKVARFPAPTVLLFLAYTLAYTHNYVTGERYSKLLCGEINRRNAAGFGKRGTTYPSSTTSFDTDEAGERLRRTPATSGIMFSIRGCGW